MKSANATPGGKTRGKSVRRFFGAVLILALGYGCTQALKNTSATDHHDAAAFDEHSIQSYAARSDWAPLAKKAPAQPTSHYIDILPSDMGITRRAYDLFLRNCPGLKTVSPLVERVEVRDLSVVLFPEGKQHKWPIAVTVQVYFTDEAIHNVLTMGFLVPKIAQFALGAGAEPGITAVGNESTNLCTQRSEPFVSVAALRFLTHWPSDNDPS